MQDDIPTERIRKTPTAFDLEKVKTLTVDKWFCRKPDEGEVFRKTVTLLYPVPTGSIIADSEGWIFYYGTNYTRRCDHIASPLTNLQAGFEAVVNG